MILLFRGVTMVIQDRGTPVRRGIAGAKMPECSKGVRTMKCRVACVQMDVRMGHVADNLAAVQTALGQTTEAGCTLTIFPECCLTGYCFEGLDEARNVAESIPGPSTDRIMETCRQIQAYAVFGMLERVGEDLFNACVLAGPNGVVGRYRKIHLPYLGVDRFATPGDGAFEVYEAGPMRVGMNICYDASFPEAARVLALRGADLVALPTNWPPGAELTAEHVIHARALENNIYYAATNRVGKERGFEFIGKSQICGPDGATLAMAPDPVPTTLYAEIDVARARAKRITRIPGKHVIDRFADRRPEMYGPVVEKKQA